MQQDLSDPLHYEDILGLLTLGSSVTTHIKFKLAYWNVFIYCSIKWVLGCVDEYTVPDVVVS